MVGKRERATVVNVRSANDVQSAVERQRVTESQWGLKSMVCIVEQTKEWQAQPPTHTRTLHSSFSARLAAARSGSLRSVSFTKTRGTRRSSDDASAAASSATSGTKHSSTL